jgi:hypothetical protein
MSNEVVFYETQYVKHVSFDACPEYYESKMPPVVQTVEDTLYKEWILNQFTGIKRDLIALLFEDHNIHSAAQTLCITNSTAYRIRNELKHDIARLLQRPEKS